MGLVGGRGGGGSGQPAFTSGLTKANTSTFRALAQGNTRNLRVNSIGDSTQRGQSFGVGTSQAVNAWPMQLASQLSSLGIANIKSGANNVWCDGGSWGLGQTIANFLTGDGRCSITGGTVLGAGKSPGGNAFAMTAASTLVFTPQGNFDTVDVFWRDGASGRNITIQIGSDTAVAANSSGTTQLIKTTVSKTGGVVGSYAITLTWVLGSAGALGISAYDSTRKELTFWNWGICGGTSANMIDNTDTAVGRVACIANALTSPDLSLIEGGVINDWRTSISVATSQANLTTLITDCLAVGNAILIIPPFDNGVAGFTSNQQAYVNMMYALAASFGIGVFDIRTRWVSYANAVANGWQTNSDSVHPTTAGYADIATQLVPVIRYAIS